MDLRQFSVLLPLEADEITAFLKRSQKLVAMAVEKE